MTTDSIQLYLRRYWGGFVHRYPRFSRWLLDRLTTDTFKGLPLTVLVGLLVVDSMVLSEVAENIVNSEPMVQVDGQFTQWLFRDRNLATTRTLYALTWLGSGYVTIGLALIGSLVLRHQQKTRNIVILWILMAGVGSCVQLGKRTFIRARPLKVAYYPETGYSFPSGHAATAMTLYGLLGYWLVRGRRRIRNQWLVGSGAVLLILIVGFSRIYLGVHFLSDVLGGYLLGGCWLIVGIVLTEWQRTTQNPNVA